MFRALWNAFCEALKCLSPDEAVKFFEKEFYKKDDPSAKKSEQKQEGK